MRIYHYFFHNCLCWNLPLLVTIAVLQLAAPVQAGPGFLSGSPDKKAYNSGVEAFKKSDFSKAVEFFGDAARTENVNVRNRSLYNLGNSFYRLGEKAESAEEMKSYWESAVEQYEAVADGEHNANARFNRNVVKAKLEILENQEKQQQESNQDQSENKDQSEDENKEDQSSSEDENSKENEQDQNQDKGKNSEDQQDQGDSQENPEDGQKPNDSNQQDKNKDDNKDADKANQNPENKEGKSDDSQQGENQENDESSQDSTDDAGKQHEGEIEAADKGKDALESSGKKPVGARFQNDDDGGMSEMAARMLLESLGGEEITDAEALKKQRRRRVKQDW